MNGASFTTVERLPDRSGKPGEGYVLGFVPDLQRIAGTAGEQSDVDDSP